MTGQALKLLAARPDAVFIAATGGPAVLPQAALQEKGCGAGCTRRTASPPTTSSASAAPGRGYADGRRADAGRR